MAEQRRLERQNGIIAGVCGGIAVRFGWSPVIVRLIFIILLLPGGLPGLGPYLLLWILMPKRKD
jgi:phage shock protein PspC (stress-responsive transcriptional regulator)